MINYFLDSCKNFTKIKNRKIIIWMKFYLSSYRFGNKTKKLKQMIGAGNRVAYIANALDFAEGQKWQREFLALDVKGFQEMGMQVEPLDLRNYFKFAGFFAKGLGKI